MNLIKIVYKMKKLELCLTEKIELKNWELKMKELISETN